MLHDMTADKLRAELRALGSSEKAAAYAWFFKTGPGQYGEGDVFIGVTVPEQRRVARGYLDLPMNEVVELLKSPEHEFRLTALIIWVEQFKRGDESVRRAIYGAYLAQAKFTNNWDLVDASAGYIVGAYLDGRDTSVLDRLAASELLWERRTAIVATFHFIKRGWPAETFRIADALAADKHDLIQKACGWMLREVGKRCSEEALVEYLGPRYRTMARTTLRYAIERFPAEVRRAYLAGLV